MHSKAQYMCAYYREGPEGPWVLFCGKVHASPLKCGCLSSKISAGAQYATGARYAPHVCERTARAGLIAVHVRYTDKTEEEEQHRAVLVREHKGSPPVKADDPPSFSPQVHVALSLLKGPRFKTLRRGKRLIFLEEQQELPGL